MPGSVLRFGKVPPSFSSLYVWSCFHLEGCSHLLCEGFTILLPLLVKLPQSQVPPSTLCRPWNEMAGKSLCFFFFLDLTYYIPGYFTGIKNLRVLFKPNASTNIRSLKIFVLMYYLPILPILIKNMNFSFIDL